MPREPGANSRREPLTGLSWSGGLPAGRGSTRPLAPGTEQWDWAVRDGGRGLQFGV